ncbi:hypothetical protein N7533_012758 [Penicillium manginii]|uniref:uncharacterized protein n=1 Tax=Penicillium manginii TaxID=203109 RepID=UPI00254834CD|nr:uncharacterized protein N7533_012758 [Penicillium manginii]KAJ5739974.1 hypothetical protein N7533_012758 [Penicillium manginii]
MEDKDKLGRLSSQGPSEATMTGEGRRILHVHAVQIDLKLILNTPANQASNDLRQQNHWLVDSRWIMIVEKRTRKTRTVRNAIRLQR